MLRIFDRARRTYEVRLTTEQVAAALDELTDGDPTIPRASDLPGSLDALVDWGVLDRSQDSGRVSSIAEYRRRASVYQLTELGFLAHNAVERVIAARPDEAQLKAIALGTILEDLAALKEANLAGDPVAVHRLLDRLHGTSTRCCRWTAPGRLHGCAGPRPPRRWIPWWPERPRVPARSSSSRPTPTT